MVAFHYYGYTSLYIQGIGTLASKSRNSTIEELEHASIIADRLGFNAPSKLA